MRGRRSTKLARISQPFGGNLAHGERPVVGSDRSAPPEGVARDDARTAAVCRRVYGGRYSAEEELGRGGMGRVLRALDLRLGRAVALKVLAPGAHDDKQLRRFEQEARAAGALNHPNVVSPRPSRRRGHPADSRRTVGS